MPASSRPTRRPPRPRCATSSPTLFGSTIPFEDQPDGLLDDDTGVAAAIEVARAGDFADAVATAEYTIEDFVFTSPTEAWFRYAIDTGTSYFSQRYGTAHLIDGSWRISRGVICQDLALAGAPCEPDPGPIYPQSWYDMYGAPPRPRRAWRPQLAMPSARRRRRWTRCRRRRCPDG